MLTGNLRESLDEFAHASLGDLRLSDLLVFRLEETRVVLVLLSVDQDVFGSRRLLLLLLGVSCLSL